MLKIENRDELFNITIHVSNNMRIRELIKTAVNTFNTLFSNYKILYNLREEYKSYNLKPSKKNGHPKSYLPSNYCNKLDIDKNTFISSICMTNLYLIYKEEDLIQIRPRSKCFKCIIF